MKENQTHPEPQEADRAASEPEFLMENVMPEDLPSGDEKTPYVPSSRGRRILAWVLFAVLALGLIFWLLNIAWPGWIDALRAKLF